MGLPLVNINFYMYIFPLTRRSHVKETDHNYLKLILIIAGNLFNLVSKYRNRMVWLLTSSMSSSDETQQIKMVIIETNFFKCKHILINNWIMCMPIRYMSRKFNYRKVQTQIFLNNLDFFFRREFEWPYIKLCYSTS